MVVCLTVVVVFLLGVCLFAPHVFLYTLWCCVVRVCLMFVVVFMCCAGLFTPHVFLTVCLRCGLIRGFCFCCLSNLYTLCFDLCLFV